MSATSMLSRKISINNSIKMGTMIITALIQGSLKSAMMTISIKANSRCSFKSQLLKFIVTPHVTKITISFSIETIWTLVKFIWPLIRSRSSRRSTKSRWKRTWSASSVSYCLPCTQVRQDTWSPMMVSESSSRWRRHRRLFCIHYRSVR